jgi:hypothetical protein
MPVNPNSTIVLSSVSGSDNPTNCVNTVPNVVTLLEAGLMRFHYALPAGVTGSYNSGTRVLQSVVLHLQSWNFSYTVTTQGLCSNAFGGSITVNPDSTINFKLRTD